MDNLVGMSGDRGAFEAAFRAHHAAVYRFVVRRVERPAVEDVVGETFLVAWRRYDTLAGDPLPWLLGIARRVCANHLRGRERRAELKVRLAAQPAPAAAPDRLAADTAVFTALAGLRDADREAILLVAWDGLSNDQAAKVLECGVGTFGVRLYRARRRLARAIDAASAEQDVSNSDPEGAVEHELR